MRHTHITNAINTTVFALLLLSSISSLASNTNKVEQADSLIKQWLSIEQQRNAMLNDWHQQQPLLEQRLVLLQQEQKQLELDLSEASNNDSDVEEKRSQLLESQNTMEAEQAQLETALVNYYQIINELQPQLPPPLVKAWQKKLAADNFTQADTTTKLTTLLELLEQLNDFEKRVSHLQSALVIQGESGEKEVMVHQLYLGLSQAWYVSLDGALVGRGQPVSGQWQWLADDSIDSDTVLKAISMIERKTEAQFLQLPISLTGAK